MNACKAVVSASLLTPLYIAGFAHFVLGLAAYSLMGIWQRLVKTMLRSVMASFSYALGHSTSIPAHKACTISKDEKALPVITSWNNTHNRQFVAGSL